MSEPRNEEQELETFRAYRATGDRGLRNEMIERYRGLAIHLAQKYAQRSEPLDDLIQVAMIGVLKAVERFDPERGIAFASFAAPTITGELKRHFRDRTWSVHIPRSLHDQSNAVRAATEELATKLGRAPKPQEIATQIGSTVERVLEAQEVANARFSYSHPMLGGSTNETSNSSGSVSAGVSRGSAQAFASDEGDFDRVDAKLTSKFLLDSLPTDESEILRRYFYGEESQQSIAEQLNISQMQVSRLIRSALRKLRTNLEVENLDN